MLPGRTVRLSTHGDLHRGEFGLTWRQPPLLEQQRCSDINGPHGGVADPERLAAEEAALAQRAHDFDVAGVAQRLLGHVGHSHRLQQGAQTVGVECFERADRVDLHQFWLGEGRPGHDAAGFHQAGGAGVLLQHVHWGEGRLVLPGPGAPGGQPADQTVKPLHGHSAGVVAQNEVAQPRRNAAIHHRGDAAGPSQRIQLEGVFIKERDIDDVHPGCDDGAQCCVAHETGHCADHQVSAATGRGHRPRICQISNGRRDRIAGG